MQLAQSLRQPSHELAKRTVAVVLNGNARSVNQSLISQLRRKLPEQTIFVSESADQAKFIARQIVNRRFDVVLCGGGDGTFTKCVTDVLALNPSMRPAFGVLRLGTGNAVADVLGASSGLRGLVRDVDNARAPGVSLQMPMLRVENRLTPFAGIGIDALILEDYNAVKRELGRTPLRTLSQGQAGYGLAIATRSLWRYLLEKRPEVVIRNEGSVAQPVDLRGAPTGPALGRGEVLYRGPVTLAAVSTVPCYGFGARLFPQACLRPDRFQLRVGNIPLRTLLTQLPQVLSGEFQHERMWDYACTALSIEINSPTPLQIGGDLVGHRTRLRVGMTSIDAIAGANGVDCAPAPIPFALAS